MSPALLLIDKTVHAFLPRESNDHKARALQVPGLIIFLLVIVLVQMVLNFITTTDVKVLGYAANISPREVIRLTNEKRLENNVHALELSPILTEAARLKGSDMLERDYWAHNAPDGTEPWVFFVNAGYKYRYAGENLARDFSNPKDAVEAWMASPSHRENLLSDRYREIGIAVVEGDLNGVDTTIIVQFFGTLAVDTVPVVPVAAAKSIESTPAPTPSPLAKPATEVFSQTQQIAQRSSTQSQKLISPFQVTKFISLGVIAILSITLVIDGLIIYQKKITRVSGKTFAHFSFIGMIFAIILIAKAGQIF